MCVTHTYVYESLTCVMTFKYGTNHSWHTHMCTNHSRVSWRSNMVRITFKYGTDVTCVMTSSNMAWLPHVLPFTATLCEKWLTCDTPLLHTSHNVFKYGMGWLRLVGSIKFYVSFAKEPYKRDNILQKRPIILIDPTHHSHPIWLSRMLPFPAAMCENWLTCDTQLLHTCHDVFKYGMAPSRVAVYCRVVWDMTHVWHSFTCDVTWLLQTWHDSLKCCPVDLCIGLFSYAQVFFHIYRSLLTQLPLLQTWHDSLKCCYLLPRCVRHDSYMTQLLRTCLWLLQMWYNSLKCGTTHSNVAIYCRISLTWLIYDTTPSHVS